MNPDPRPQEAYWRVFLSGGSRMLAGSIQRIHGPRLMTVPPTAISHPALRLLLPSVAALGHATVVHVVKFELGSDHGAGLGLGGLADAGGPVDLGLLNHGRVVWVGSVQARFTGRAGAPRKQHCQCQGKTTGRRGHAVDYTPRDERRLVNSKFAGRVAEAFPRGLTAGAVEELSQPEK